MDSKKKPTGSKSFSNASYISFPAERQKRKKARIAVDIEGQIEIPGHPALDCRVISLGTGGLTIIVSTILYTGDLVKIRFRLNLYEIHTEAEVVRVSGKEAGMKFLNLGSEETERIQSFIYRDVFNRTLD